MIDDPEKPIPPPTTETTLPAVEEAPNLEVTSTGAEPPPPPPMEEFPERINCPQCRRPYRTESLHTRANTLLTETLLTCPRCRRKLHKMRLKDWYDHYVQGQTPETVLDDQTFAPKMLSMPQPSRPPPGQRPSERRPNNRRRRHGRRHRR